MYKNTKETVKNMALRHRIEWPVICDEVDINVLYKITCPTQNRPVLKNVMKK